MLRSTPQASLLMVDDDPSIVHLVRRMLQTTFRESLAITSTTDPQQAARFLDESVWDILLTDIDMPHLSGIDLLQRAKRRNAWTQVVFMTGHSTWAHVSEAMGNGASDYLLKPVDRNDLETVLRDAIVRMQRWQYALSKSPRQPTERETAAIVVS